MKTFRSQHPQRTYSGRKKTNYRDYHATLAEDFNHRCAYTDCRDYWWGDGFNIDHFAPREPGIEDVAKRAKFMALENDYANLVYACPQVNRAKSNDWPSDDPMVPIVGEQGYLDPCMDFNEYFERTDTGGIIPKDDPIARYMWRKLKLYLKRYELYWRLDQLHDQKLELHRLRRLPQLSDAHRQEIERTVTDLDEAYTSYIEYFAGNYRSIIR